MNILFIMGVFPGIGGVERTTIVLANKFVKEGHNVSLLSFWSKEDDLIHSLSKSINHIHFDPPVLSINNIKKLHNYVVSQEVNIIINQWCIPYYVSAFIQLSTRKTSCKFIAVHHNIPSTNNKIQELQNKRSVKNNLLLSFRLYLVKALSRFNLRLTYNCCDAFVVLSESHIPILKSFIGKQNAKRISAIPNPITLEPDTEIHLPKEKIILYVGRLEYTQKRPDRIIEIWQYLEQKLTDWKLIIIGDGPYREECEHLANKYELKNIFFTGFKDPTNYYEKAKLLLLTSEYEGFGLVILESMRFGVIPVVYNSFPAAQDIIENQVNGILLQKPFSALEAADIIYSLICQNNLMSTISYNAIEKSKRFSINEIYGQWMNLFQIIQ